jgi:phage protein Gp37/Gp68
MFVSFRYVIFYYKGLAFMIFQIIQPRINATPYKPHSDIRDQYLRAKVPFFFKQWGGVQKKRAGRTLEGRTWDEMPKNLVRA